MSTGAALVMMFALGALMALNAVVPIVVLTWGQVRDSNVTDENGV